MTRNRGIVMSAAAAALALCATFVLSGCGPSSQPTTYSNPTQRFSMTVPAGWTCRETTGAMTVILTGPASPSGSQPNVNVEVAPTAHWETLDKFAQRTRDTLQPAYRNDGFTLIAEEPLTLADGTRAASLTFEQSIVGPSPDVRATVRQRQVYVVAFDRVYTLTATAAPETFEACAPQFAEIFQSFHAGW
jgi:hypothetical protein